MIVLKPEAEQDLAGAVVWYERQRQGLGGQFLAETDLAMARIESNPRLYRKVHGELRRALMRRFPYAVYFLADEGTVTVYGVLHQRRAPAVWQRRYPG